MLSPAFHTPKIFATKIRCNINKVKYKYLCNINERNYRIYQVPQTL